MDPGSPLAWERRSSVADILMKPGEIARSAILSVRGRGSERELERVPRLTRA